jgi:hypothetical protein
MAAHLGITSKSRRRVEGAEGKHRRVFSERRATIVATQPQPTGFIIIKTRESDFELLFLERGRLTQPMKTGVALVLRSQASGLDAMTVAARRYTTITWFSTVSC